MSDLKCYRNVFSSSTNHLWNAKPNKHAKKKTVKKISFFELQNAFIFIFSSFWPLLLHHCITFSSFVQIEQFNCSKIAILNFANHLISNKIIFKDLFKGFGNKLWVVWSKLFYKNDPFLWGAITFSTLICFCQFLVRQMHPKESSIYSLDTINNGALLQKQWANITSIVWTLACLPRL